MEVTIPTCQPTRLPPRTMPSNFPVSFIGWKHEALDVNKHGWPYPFNDRDLVNSDDGVKQEDNSVNTGGPYAAPDVDNTPAMNGDAIDPELPGFGFSEDKGHGTLISPRGPCIEYADLAGLRSDRTTMC